VDLSRKDLLRNLSIPTTRSFNRDEPVTFRNIQAVAAVPENFGLVKSIKPDGAGRVMITDGDGLSAVSLVDWNLV